MMTHDEEIEDIARETVRLMAERGTNVARYDDMTAREQEQWIRVSRAVMDGFLQTETGQRNAAIVHAAANETRHGETVTLEDPMDPEKVAVALGDAFMQVVRFVASQQPPHIRRRTAICTGAVMVNILAGVLSTADQIRDRTECIDRMLEGIRGEIQ